MCMGKVGPAAIMMPLTPSTIGTATVYSAEFEHHGNIHKPIKWEVALDFEESCYVECKRLREAGAEWNMYRYMPGYHGRVKSADSKSTAEVTAAVVQESSSFSLDRRRRLT